ncbi:unnamed protein product [Blepharisma stoltei]|uniref:Uncharacterized protein n=1 Tax=Blepharisma stoltei TaxID=1481888 RepID=A0AAU9K3S6_9CILI|nr:unnamed protein product [Blepharisma stoltei]
METIKQQPSQMVRRSMDATLRVSNRVRKPTSHFTPTNTPVKESHENAIVNCSCSRPHKRTIFSNFTSQTSMKFDKFFDKVIKSLKLSLNGEFIIVYFSKEERKWKKIRELENLDPSMTYKLRIYKKPQPKKEVVKVEASPPAAPIIEEKEKPQPVNKQQLPMNPMMLQYGFYCYWYYMMYMRGIQFGSFMPFS